MWLHVSASRSATSDTVTCNPSMPLTGGGGLISLHYQPYKWIINSGSLPLTHTRACCSNRLCSDVWTHNLWTKCKPNYGRDCRLQDENCRLLLLHNIRLNNMFLGFRECHFSVAAFSCPSPSTPPPNTHTHHHHTTKALEHLSTVLTTVYLYSTVLKKTLDEGGYMVISPKNIVFICFHYW